MPKHSKYFQDVIDFHEKFVIAHHGPPRQSLPLPLRVFRKDRLREEHNEYVDAFQRSDAEGMLDALVDLVYIAIGTAQCHGWDFDEAWDRVHASNMTKKRISPKSTGRYNHRSDIVKPDGWVSPSHADLVGRPETNHCHKDHNPAKE